MVFCLLGFVAGCGVLMKSQWPEPSTASIKKISRLSRLHNQPFPTLSLSLFSFSFPSLFPFSSLFFLHLLRSIAHQPFPALSPLRTKSAAMTLSQNENAFKFWQVFRIHLHY